MLGSWEGLWTWDAISASTFFPIEEVIGLLVGVTKLQRVRVLRLGVVAEANAGLQGEKGSWNLASGFGVWKEFKKKVGEVGVFVGVGGSPPG